MSKTKTLLKKIVALLLFFLLSFSTVGCRGNIPVENNTGSGGGNHTTQEIDKDKSQLYVFNYNGGVGTEWLYATADAFEAKYAETSFEEGKKGVEIKVSPGKSTLGNIKGTNYDIAFSEGVNFHDFITRGEFLDITDIVTESLSEITNGVETGSIEDKLVENQKYSYKAVKGGYYALPNYESWPGVTYDRKVFRDYELYFAEGGGWTNVDSQKTVGPDGVRNTSDDGLPSSLEEFVTLIKRMKALNVTPILTSGAYTVMTNKLITAIYSNLVGYDEFMLNFSYGEDTIAKTTDVDTSANIITGFNSEGTPIIEKKTITMSNSYYMMQDYGMYYAYEIMRTLIDEKAWSKKMTGVLSHLDAQTEFIYSDLENNPIAMYVDGCYWYNEASDAFKRSEKKYKEAAVNRDFAWMPMPVQVSGSVTEGHGRQPVLLDELRTFGFLNADLKGKPTEKLAKLFLQFCYTDEMLKLFTRTTKMFRGVKYEFTDSEYADLCKYAQSVAEIRSRARVLYPYTDNIIDIYNQKHMNPGLYDTVIGGATENTPYDAMKGTSVTARQYFEGGWISPESWTQQYGEYFNK